MMQQAYVSQGKTKMEKMVKRELHCVRRLRLLHRGWVVRGAVLMSMEMKKVMDRRRRNKEKD
jgi:hypothetical protein